MKWQIKNSKSFVIFLLFGLFAFFGILLPTQAFAEIAFDSYSNGSITSSSITVAHTVTANSNAILVACVADDGIGTVSATYNGDAMTEITNVLDTNSYFKFTCFSLVNPDSGEHNIIVTRSNNSGSIYVKALSYYGVSGIGESTTNAQTAGTSQTTTLNNSTSNSWDVLFSGADAGGLTASTNSTIRGSISDGWLGIFDSASNISAGNYSMTVSMTNGLRTSLMFSIKPYEATSTPVSTSTNQFLQFAGVDLKDINPWYMLLLIFFGITIMGFPFYGLMWVWKQIVSWFDKL